MVSDGMYIVFIPVFTILAFIIGSFLAYIAFTANQQPTGDDPSDTEAAH